MVAKWIGAVDVDQRLGFIWLAKNGQDVRRIEHVIEDADHLLAALRKVREQGRPPSRALLHPWRAQRAASSNS